MWQPWETGQVRENDESGRPDTSDDWYQAVSVTPTRDNNNEATDGNLD